MIFFIDDDCEMYQAWLDELELRRLETRAMRSADEAFRALWNANAGDVAPAIIDVMLAVVDIYDPRFSPERTDAYLETGLRLLEDFAAQNPSVFPARAVLLSNTANEHTYRNARAVSAELGVPFWEKSTIASPVDFADRVLAQVRLIDATGGLRR